MRLSAPALDGWLMATIRGRGAESAAGGGEANDLRWLAGGRRGGEVSREAGRGPTPGVAQRASGCYSRSTVTLIVAVTSPDSLTGTS